MSLNFFHVDVTGDGEAARYGVCAVTKTDAAALVMSRAREDGYQKIRIGDIRRVSGANLDTWYPGQVYRYS